MGETFDDSLEVFHAEISVVVEIVDSESMAQLDHLRAARMKDRHHVEKVFKSEEVVLVGENLNYSVFEGVALEYGKPSDVFSACSEVPSRIGRMIELLEIVVEGLNLVAGEGSEPGELDELVAAQRLVGIVGRLRVSHLLLLGFTF